MKKSIYALLVVLTLVQIGYSQNKPTHKKALLIVEKLIPNNSYLDSLLLNHNTKLKLDSIFDKNKIELNISETNDKRQSDSLFTNNTNVIYISYEWIKCVGDRHCFGDWTTGLIWQCNYIMQIKRAQKISKYKLEPTLFEGIPKWIFSCFIDADSDRRITSERILIKPHTFSKITKSYLDSIQPNNINNRYSSYFKDRTKWTEMDSSYILIHPIGSLENNILAVKYEYIESINSKIIKTEKRTYIIEDQN